VGRRYSASLPTYNKMELEILQFIFLGIGLLGVIIVLGYWAFVISTLHIIVSILIFMGVITTLGGMMFYYAIQG